MPVGFLANDAVIVPDPADASRIYNKGYHGIPLSGGGLKLTLLEAAYLLDVGRLEICTEDATPLELPALIARGIAHEEGFEIRYLVYRDIRERGYIVKTASPLDFRVFSRGETPKRSPSKYWLAARSERATLTLASLFGLTLEAESLRKRLWLAIVDEEGDLTFYTARPWRPGQARNGSPPAHAEPCADPDDQLASPDEGRENEEQHTEADDDSPARSYLLEDRVMVWDADAAVELHRLAFYGKFIGDALQLSLLEAAYLLAEGRIVCQEVGTEQNLTLDTLVATACEHQPDLLRRLSLYRYLKHRGLIVKTGFKYGTHFRVYHSDPESQHAQWLVHAYPADHISSWPQISGAVRLAHGVRKEMVFALVSDLSAGAKQYWPSEEVVSERVRCFTIKRIKP